MKFTKIRAPDFDLEKTLDSGQVFHWEKNGDGFVGAIGNLPLYIEQRGEFLKVRFGWPPFRLGDLRELRKRSYSNANSAIAPKTCARRRGSSAPAKRISKRGRCCLMLTSENTCAHCQAWGRRLQIA